MYTDIALAISALAFGIRHTHKVSKVKTQNKVIFRFEKGCFRHFDSIDYYYRQRNCIQPSKCQTIIKMNEQI